MRGVGRIDFLRHDDKNMVKAKIERPKHYKIFRRPRDRAFRGLNDAYVINALSRNALQEFKRQLKTEKQVSLPFDVFDKIKQHQIVEL